MHFPHSSKTEAYHDAIPPKDGQHHCLTAYSNVCWGSQLTNAVQEGMQLPLFKFCSMSSTIVMQLAGPLSWKADRQDRTSLISCKAVQTKNQSIKHWMSSCGKYKKYDFFPVILGIPHHQRRDPYSSLQQK